MRQRAWSHAARILGAAARRGPRRPPRAARTTPDEHQEQVALIEWSKLCRAQYPELGLLFAIPNGARTSMRTAIKLKAEGLVAGMPDLLLPVARRGFYGLFLEMKRQDSPPSAVSTVQRAIHLCLRREGYAVEVCKGFDEARRVLVAYLSDERG